MNSPRKTRRGLRLLKRPLARRRKKRAGWPAQIAENTALANDARARADAAQAQADAAFKSAVMANNRINGLDSYDTIKSYPGPLQIKQRRD